MLAKISPSRQKLIVCILLVIGLLVVYGQVTQYGFVSLDDDDYVRKNHHIRLGLEGVRWAFSSVYAQFWHPLTWLSLMLDYRLYGPNAGGYHLTSLILHILSSLLLFGLLVRMSRDIGKSAFVAAFFAVHPLRVESVVWISERKDVLCVFFWMLTLCLYVYYTAKPNWKRFVAVFVSFGLALMSKPMAVTLPVMMILLDDWPLNRPAPNRMSRLWWQTKEKMPFFVLSVFFSVMTLYNDRMLSSGQDFPLTDRISNALVSLAAYLGKIFWPYHLTVSYPFRFQISVWQILVAVIVTAGVTVGTLCLRKRHPYLWMGWLAYVLIIIPVLGVIQNGDYGMADRYTYLPSIGISIMMAWGIPSLVTDERIRKRMLQPAAVALLVMMAVITFKQCGYWKDSFALFNRALRVTRNNFIAHNDLGVALYEKGRYEEAIRHYTEAIRIAPRYAYAYNNRATAYAKLGLYPKALDDFQTAVRLKPDYAAAYNNRAYLHFLQGNRALGCADARKACAMRVCVTLHRYQALCR